MGLFASRILWNGWVRFFLFWIAAAGVSFGIARVWPALDLELLQQTLQESWEGRYDGVSSEAFAFALASGLATLAAALAAAFLTLHAVMIPLAIGAARRRVERARTMQDFVASYPTIHAALARHPLVGHSGVKFLHSWPKRFHQ